MNITFDSEQLTNSFPLSDYDLCSLIGNILDNAIEASKDADNPYISFSIKKEGNCCIIQCNNTFLNPPKIINNRFQTTKHNKKTHGIGTQIIKSIAYNNNGTAVFNIDTLFCVTVSIPY